MKLPVTPGYAPMEARLAAKLPSGEGWLYEPKWDGFRCLVFRAGDEVALRSKAGKPLDRYFPDVVEAVTAIGAERFVLDGEIVVPVEGTLSFDDLLQRIHPAESRVQTLARRHPAELIVFDLLVDAEGGDLTGGPLRDRRQALERFAAQSLPDSPRIHLSPATEDPVAAGRWLADSAAGLDGVMAKQLDAAYASGDRTAMVKVKRMRTADCVVGGYRTGKDGGIGSLLLGLHDEEGLLHHVGFCSALNAKRRQEAVERVMPLRGGAGFSGSAPKGSSRWRKEGSGEWEPLEPVLVVEVSYDHFTQGRFRHGTRFERWRPDKAPEQCRLSQVEQESSNAMGML